MERVNEIYTNIKANSPDLKLKVVSDRAYINVHLAASDPVLQVQQFGLLGELCIALHMAEKAHTMIIGGDFNAEFRQEENGDDIDSVHFFDKERHDEHRYTLTVPDARVVATKLSAPTTAKRRFWTTQFPKMLVPSKATIDGFIIVSFDPEFVAPDPTTATCRVAGEMIGADDVICPLKWFSDHGAVHFHDGHASLITLNTSGESGEGLNFFEFFSEEVHRTLFSSPEGEIYVSRITAIMDQLPGWFQMLIRDKKNKPISRALRPYNVFNIHWHPFFGDEGPVADKWRKEYAAFIEGTKDDPQTRAIGNVVLDLWRQFVNNELLWNLLRGWYHEASITEKPTLCDAVIDMINITEGRPLVIFLQEVSKQMLSDLLTLLRNRRGVTVDYDPSTDQQKTRGVLIFADA